MSRISNLSYALTQPGQINTPGISYESKKTVEDLLLLDAEKHHCYFRSSGFHNHLSHHLLAAYDLGASPALLKKIYEDEAKTQRPIVLEEKDQSIVVNDDNWNQYLGNQSAYAAYLSFFSQKISESGNAASVVTKYVFEESANTNEKSMLIRLFSGVYHPFIQVAYGAEFGNDTLIATGLAQTAVHTLMAPEIYKFYFPSISSSESPQNGAPNEKPPSGEGLSVLEIFKKMYDSPTLAPPEPYEPDALYVARLRRLLEGGRPEEILRLCDEFVVDVSAPPSNEVLDSKISELILVSTLLFAATGRPNREVRLDFFLMHCLTSSLFLKPLVELLARVPPATDGTNAVAYHQANLLRGFLATTVFQCLARGRPRVRPELVMGATAVPRPPSARKDDSTNKDDPSYIPWQTLLSSVITHPDSHVLKAMRTLVHAARLFGTTPPGGFAGSSSLYPNSTSTSVGPAPLDGTVFVRAAGMLLDYMGWVGHGQKAREDWDRSALGWDAAWDQVLD